MQDSQCTRQILHKITGLFKTMLLVKDKHIDKRAYQSAKVI